MTRPYQNAYPVTFFGKMLTFSRIKLATNDFDVIAAHLAEVSPNKDSQIPIIIDTDVEIDLKQLTDLLWEWGLQPIGITRGVLDEQAKTIRMPIFPANGKRMQRVAAHSRETSAPKEQVTITPMQERFAKQIQELKKPPIQEECSHNDRQEKNKAMSPNDEPKDNLKNNPHPKVVKNRQGLFSSQALKSEDENTDSNHNLTNDLSNSEPPASESKKNTALKTQQTESIEKEPSGTRASSSTKPTTSKTTINKLQEFIKAPKVNDHITSKVYD